MNELRKCPFCGSDAVMVTHKHIPSGFDYTQDAPEYRARVGFTKSTAIRIMR